MSRPSSTPSNDSPLRVLIEPLGPSHDRAGFRCGNSYIDTQLQRSILPMHDRNLVRAFVAVRPGTVEVLGFYALHSHSIMPWECPPHWNAIVVERTLGGIPAAYISLFATSTQAQRRGIGKAMMADALRRIKAAAQTLGMFAVVLDAADQKALEFYERLGFVRLQQGMRMFYPVSAIG